MKQILVLAQSDQNQCTVELFATYSAGLFVAEKKADGTDEVKKAGSKKGMDIFADDDDMFSENYSQVIMTFLLHRCVKYLHNYSPMLFVFVVLGLTL